MAIRGLGVAHSNSFHNGFTMRIATTLIAVLITTTTVTAAAPNYDNDVAPLFRKYCIACHGSDEPEKGFALDTYAALIKGGESGAAVVGGASERSRLVLMLTGKAKPAMPPEGSEAPSAEEIAKIVGWIDAGAKGPTGDAPDPTILVTPKIKTVAPPREPITAAAFSPDGKLLALGGYGQVQLIDPVSRQVMRTIASLRGNVTDVAFSADGSTIVAAAGEPSLFGEATLCDVKTGKVLRKFTGHKDSLYAVAISPDATVLATGSYDQQIKLWDAATGKELRTLVGHNGAIFDLAFHPKGKILASASGDRTIKLWKVANGARLDTLSQPLKDQYTLAFSPDGKHLAAGGVDNRVRIYGISASAAENTNPILYTRFAHEGAVLRLAYSTDGKTLVTSGEDRAVRLWRTKDYTELKQMRKLSDWPQALAMSPDATRLAVALVDGTWDMYDPKTGKAVPPPAPGLTSLTSIEPRGVEHGVKTRVMLRGQNLAWAYDIKISGDDAKLVTAKLLAPDDRNPDQRWCEITVDKKVTRRTMMLAVAGQGGLSKTVPLYVDDIAQLSEHEPNNAESAANTITTPTTVWGAIGTRGDVDRFVFEGQAGQTIVVELAAKRIGSELNGFLNLLNSDGEVVASNNDFDGATDPLLAYTLPKSGRYTVRVQDLLAMSSDKTFYRLSIGAFPYVTGVFPLAVAEGAEMEVDLIGYNLPPDSRGKLVKRPTGFEVSIDASRFRALREFRVMSSTDVEVIERENNDTVEQAMSLPTIPEQGGVSVNGRIATAIGAEHGDVDLYRFEARKGQELIIETTAAQRGSPIDTKIEILDAKGHSVDRVLLQAVLDSYVTFRFIDSDAAAVRVKNWEEMALNEFMYMQGEVCKIFRMPEGPDSGFEFYKTGNKRRTYFDTSSTAHAIDDPCYIVEAHTPGSDLTPNGLPVFTLPYSNDDDADRKLGTDSRIAFVAPADGSYIARVSDSRGFGGDRFVYRLTVRPRKPDFTVRVAPSRPMVTAGDGVSVAVRCERLDNFDEDIRVDFADLPEGFSITSPIIIEAGHLDARAVITVDNQPNRKWTGMRATATATIAGKQVVKDLPKMASLEVGPTAKIGVSIEPKELVIAPGATVQAMLRIERRDFDAAVGFDVPNLPHGVVVDNIGLNGILIPAGKTEREIFISAASWVEDLDRPFFAETKTARGGNKLDAAASAPAMLKVRKPSTLAEASMPQDKAGKDNAPSP